MSNKSQVKSILQNHTGKDEAITSSKILDKIGLADENGNPNIRSIITELIQDGEPIAASTKGYYYIDSQQELDEYKQTLHERKAGIQARIDNVENAWNQS